MKENTSKLTKVLFFLLGLSSFFVKNEPSPFEFIAIIILVSNVYVLKKSDLISIICLTLLLNISTFFSYNLERSLQYNLVTIYLISLGFLFYRHNYTVIKMFIYGGIIGIILTLLISIFSPDLIDAWYYNRLMGGFKDPNVLAPTTLFFIILLNEINVDWNKKILFVISTIALVLIVLAQSRAALGITLFYILYKFFNKSKKISIFTILSIILLWMSFSTITLTGIYKDNFGARSDNRRFGGQVEALRIATLLGNGATSSDYYVGHPPHNSIVRIISDNGIFVFSVLLIWFLILLPINNFSFPKFYLLSIAIVFGLVIDTLHWRILFIYIGCILFIYKNKRNGKLYI
jgi:hypothetical protein